MKESRLWMLFLLAAILIFFLLGIHMFVQHMDAFLGFFGVVTGEPLEYSSVTQRAQSVSWNVLYVLLLVAALYHGLYGLRTVLIEWAPQATSLITGILLAIGIVALVFGTYVTMTFAGMGGV